MQVAMTGKRASCCSVSMYFLTTLRRYSPSASRADALKKAEEAGTAIKAQRGNRAQWHANFKLDEFSSSYRDVDVLLHDLRNAGFGHHTTAFSPVPILGLTDAAKMSLPTPIAVLTCAMGKWTSHPRGSEKSLDQVRIIDAVVGTVLEVLVRVCPGATQRCRGSCHGSRRGVGRGGGPSVPAAPGVLPPGQAEPDGVAS